MRKQESGCASLDRMATAREWLASDKAGEPDGGGGGIRTHGAFGTRDFQSRPLGLYGTPPDTRGGRGGIRTHGALLGLTAFRERHLKPLGHPSAGEYSTVADSPASSG